MPETDATEQPQERNRRKTREGLVVGTAMDKTAIVAIVDRVRHRRYDKTVQRVTKLYVHDEERTPSTRATACGWPRPGR